MMKNILIGIVILGGLVLINTFLKNSPEEGEVVLAENETNTPSIPSDLPAIPVFPGSVVKNVTDTDGEKSRDVSLRLSATATIKEVNEWYREALKSNGWSIKSDKNIGGYQIIQGENANLYTSMQAANGSEAGEVIISQQIKIRK